MSSYGLESLAIHGRHGDTLIGHLSTGEMVLPRPIANDPILKRELFNAFERHELNPNQYSVGHYENSLNPITGVPEFGFFKKIGKSIKKAASTIGTVVGFAVGGPAGAAIGGGIGGGVQTGSLKGAVKGAATGYVLGNVASGFGVKGGGGLKSLNPFSSDSMFRGLDAAAPGGAEGGIGGFFKDIGASGRGFFGGDLGSYEGGLKGIGESFKALTGIEKAAALGIPAYASGIFETVPEEPADMPSPSGALSGYLQNPLGGATTPIAPGGGLIAGNYGNTGGTNTGIGGVGVINTTSSGLDPATDEYLRRTLGDEDYNKLMFPQFARANLNSGGEALDLRNSGGDIEDPEGSGDEDTVNAILADGEFVVTKQAVKGIGDGDHDKGIETLYAMMNENENKAKSMGIGRA